jgi:hypothetical protein
LKERAAAGFIAPSLRRALTTWCCTLHSRDAVARKARAIVLLSARRALSRWVMMRYSARAEGAFQRLVHQRTHELQALATSLRNELDVAQRAMQDAQNTALDAAERAQWAESELEARTQQQATELATLAQDLAARKQAVDLERQELRSEMCKELDMAHEEQVSRIRAEIEQQARFDHEAQWRDWQRESAERERSRDQVINALRLKLGLTQTSVCRLLVDNGNTSDYLMRKRMEEPPRALHSLVARARADEPKAAIASPASVPQVTTPRQRPSTSAFRRSTSTSTSRRSVSSARS